jgi:leucyl aminopeptidase
MRFLVKTVDAASVAAGCLVLPVYSAGSLPAATRSIDRASNGELSDLKRRGDVTGELAETLMLQRLPGVAAERVLLVGLGTRGKLDRRAFRKAVRSACAALARLPATSAAEFLTSEPVRLANAYRRGRLLIDAWYETAYRFNAMKSKDRTPPPKLGSLTIAVRGRDSDSARRALAHGQAIGDAMNLARDLGNLPANVCTPSYLADQARRAARRVGRLRVEVLDEAAMRRLGMGSLLSVTAGADEPARLIVLKYQGGRKGAAPIVFVGKGITFDTGGISIKPAPQMDEMKYDMSGAGTVLAVMQAAAALRLPLNLIGLMPACENMPGGGATRPGDIVKSMSGQTIEILNTDAEGRLILCDALTYAQRFKPAAMIDIATLTGACIVALGKSRSGLLSTSDRLANALLKSGEATDDPAWRLPLGEDYMELLKSPFADVANVGGRDAGAITAAAFLARFTGQTPWAHLDIAGTAYVTTPQKGSTGRPVPLLVEYLLNR